MDPPRSDLDADRHHLPNPPPTYPQRPQRAVVIPLPPTDDAEPDSPASATLAWSRLGFCVPGRRARTRSSSPYRSSTSSASRSVDAPDESGETTTDSQERHVVAEEVPHASGGGSQRRDRGGDGRGDSVVEGMDSADAVSSIDARAIARGRRTRRILVDQCGFARKGEVLIVLGAASSGKTTLLRALSDRLPITGSSGTVSFRGVGREHVDMWSVSKLVEENTPFAPHLTVRETLEHADRWHRGVRGHTEAHARRARVQRVVKLLGLSEDATTYMHRCSEAQRKRVAIGMELLVEPPVLLIDEPTGQLDRVSAEAVMRTVTEVARTRGTTVICAITHPTQDILDMADRVLVLAKGRMAYLGTPGDSERYFAEMGFPMPDRATMADHLITLVNPNFGNAAHTSRILSHWKTSKEATALAHDMTMFDVTTDSTLSAHRNPIRTSIPTQVCWLWQILWTRHRRYPGNEGFRILSFVASALVIGSFWFDLPSSDRPLLAEAQSFAFTSSFLVLLSLFVILGQAKEWPVASREMLTRAYSPVAFVVARWGVDSLATLVAVAVGAPILYFMIGYRPGRFGAYFGVLLLTFLASDSFAAAIWSCVPTLAGSIAVFILLMGLFTLTQGHAIYRGHIIWAWRWVSYVSFDYYAYSALIVNEITGVSFPPNTVVPVNVPINEEFIRTVLHLEDAAVWKSVVVLSVMVPLLRVLSLVCTVLQLRRRHKYL